MIYSSWNIERDSPPPPPPPPPPPFKTPKNQNFEKIDKDIIILNMCIKNQNHIRYGSWNRVRQTELYFLRYGEQQGTDKGDMKND